MIIERDLDCGHLYQVKRRELMSRIRSVSAEQLRLTVPATPDWSVQDVISHLVGIPADLNALRFGAGDPDAWTAEQVTTRRGRTIPELDREWEAEAPTFEQGLRLLGYEVGSHFVGDLLQHTQDVNEALGWDRLEDDDALVAGLDFYLDAFHRALTAAAAGSVTVQIGEETWDLGSGPVVATLKASRFDAFRCFGGRRSERQIRALDWSGDLTAVLASISPYPLPLTDLGET